MNEHIKQVYLREAVTQCEFAGNALLGMNNVLPRIGSAAKAGDWSVSTTLQQEVFRSIHSFLTHASNVSRLFWPPTPWRRKRESDDEYACRCANVPRINRAVILRESAGLLEGHVLRSRELRDHLEHFDERLDDWQATSVRHNLVQDFIGGRGSIVGIEESDMMRWFDPSTKHLRFRGDEYDLQALADGVADVRTKSLAAIERTKKGISQ